MGDFEVAAGVFESSADVARLSERLSHFRRNLDRLLEDFVRTADGLIMTRLLALGFTVTEVALGQFASDRSPDAPYTGAA